jgi:predicted DNA-binding ribbon-helix-helix protein
MSTKVSRAFIASGKQHTTMRLEPEEWEALEEICRRKRLTLSETVRRIESIKGARNRTGAVRAFVVTYFRNAEARALRKAQ